MKRNTLPAVSVLAALILSCGCGEQNELQDFSSELTSEVSSDIIEAPRPSTEETAQTIEALPGMDELHSADLSEGLDIVPSYYFKPGVWRALNSEDTGNFYVFASDGMSGSFIPIFDGEGVDFVYSAQNGRAVFYFGEECTPYSAKLEKTEKGEAIILDLTGIRDELEYFSDISPEEFSFYSNRELSLRALEYYRLTTGEESEYADCGTNEFDMAEINLYNLDRAGNRIYTASYSVDRFTAVGVDLVNILTVDLSVVEVPPRDPGTWETYETVVDPLLSDIEMPTDEYEE